MLDPEELCNGSRNYRHGVQIKGKLGDRVRWDIVQERGASSYNSQFAGIRSRRPPYARVTETYDFLICIPPHLPVIVAHRGFLAVPAPVDAETLWQ